MARSTAANRLQGSDGHGLPDYMALNQMQEMVQNVITLRQEMLTSSQLDPRRNLEAECGYPDLSAFIDARTFQLLYDRDPIANRVVELFPKESWQTMFELRDSENKEETEFVASFRDMVKGLRGDVSWLRDKKGNALQSALLKADIVAGIGRYGVTVLGFDDGKPLREELIKDSASKLLYMESYSESYAQIAEVESRRGDPRYGLPVRYNIFFYDPNESSSGGWPGVVQGSEVVHWTRCLHVVDQFEHPSSNRSIGNSRLKSVWNDVLGHRKVAAVDPEAFFRAGIQKLFFSTHPQLGGDVVVDKSGFRDDIERMMNSLQQWMLLTGMGVTPVSPTLVDPKPHQDARIQSICIKKGCPVRVFMGSERGELASGQDDVAWNDRLTLRCELHNSPTLAAQLIDRCIFAGVMKRPMVQPIEDDAEPSLGGTLIKKAAAPAPGGPPKGGSPGAGGPPPMPGAPKPAGPPKPPAFNQDEVGAVAGVEGEELEEDEMDVGEEGAGGGSEGESAEGGEYWIEWPDLTSKTQAEKDASMVAKVTAMAQFADTGASSIMAPLDFYTKVMGMGQREAEEVILRAEEVSEEQAEVEEEEAALAQEEADAKFDEEVEAGAIDEAGRPLDADGEPVEQPAVDENGMPAQKPEAPPFSKEAAEDENDAEDEE